MNIYIYIYIYIYICIYKWSQVIHETQSAQISQKQVHELPQSHELPKCMSYHKAAVVITGRAHCFHDCIYIYIYMCVCVYNIYI